MDMRLQHTTIMPESSSGICRSQITVEGDVTVPGSLRDTTTILHASAAAVVETAEPGQNRVNIGGRVTFCVLYAQGETPRLDTIEATADFSHLCEMPGAMPRANVYAAAQVEHVEAYVQNSRMTMRAVVRLYARADVSDAMEVISGIAGDHVEVQQRQIRLCRTVGRGSGEVLLREEYSLPADLSIRNTLGARAKASFHDAAGGQGRIGLAGEVVIEALHASDLPGKPLVITRHTLPVSQSVEVAGEQGERLDGRIVIKDVAVASQDMGDGERMMRAEVLLGLSAWMDKEEEITVLTDAYTTSGDDVHLTGKPVSVRTGVRRMQAAESGKASLLLPEGAGPIRTMLAAFATPVMSGFTQQGNRMIAEGVLETTLVYMTGEGALPASVRVDAPFKAAFAAAADPEDIVLLTVDHVEAVPLTSDRAELRYVLHAEIEGVQTTQATMVTEAVPAAAAETTKDIVLYFPQPGEGAWEIARRYRIPLEELRALNPELTGEPKPGQGLVVWRRVVK